MKKILTSLAAIACFGMAATAAHATDGEITFNGSVVDVTCTPLVESASGSIVRLPNIAVHALSGADVTAGDTNFSISLTGCAGGNGKKVVAEFENHKATITASGRLLNILEGAQDNSGATNVQLEVLDRVTGERILLGDPSQLDATNSVIANETARLDYTVRYFSPAGPVTPGMVASVLPFTIIYQ